jgi:hypothetical protein
MARGRQRGFSLWRPASALPLSQAMTEFMTVMVTDGALATKQIRRQPKTGKLIVMGYGRAKHFSVDERRVDDMPSLASTLDRLTRAPLAFVIRGAPLPGIDRQHCR